MNRRSLLLRLPLLAALPWVARRAVAQSPAERLAARAVAPTLGHDSPPQMQDVTIYWRLHERWRNARSERVGVSAVNPAQGWAKMELRLEMDPWLVYREETGRFAVRWGTAMPHHDAAAFGSQPHPCWLAWAEAQERAGAIYDRQRQEVRTA